MIKATLVLIAATLSAANKVVTTCLEQATDQVGNVANGTPVDDYPLLVENEGETWYLQMHSVKMCYDQ